MKTIALCLALLLSGCCTVPADVVREARLTRLEQRVERLETALAVSRVHPAEDDGTLPPAEEDRD